MQQPDERYYKILKVKVSQLSLFKFEEKSPFQSKSCQKFALTEEEKSMLRECENKEKAIHQEVQILGELRYENRMLIENIQLVPDQELSVLLGKKFNQYDVDCAVDRINRVVEVRLKDCEGYCENYQTVGDLFNRFLENPCKIQKGEFENRSLLKISFQLGERDIFMEKLEAATEYSKPMRQMRMD